MTFYAALQREATALVKEFGQPCKVITESEGEYDVSTGTVDSRRKITQGFCYINRTAYDFSTYQSNGSQRASSALIEKGDVLIYLTADTIPTLLSKIQVGKEIFLVVTVQPIKPAQTALLFIVQARKER